MQYWWRLRENIRSSMHQHRHHTRQMDCGVIMSRMTAAEVLKYQLKMQELCKHSHVTILTAWTKQHIL